MKIDIYTHIAPEKYRKSLAKYVPPSEFASRMQTLWDLEARFRIMDRFDDYMQVIIVTSTPIEAVARGRDAVDLARTANDEAARLVSKYPDRFLCAAANLPLDDSEAALRELDRAVNELGLKGIVIFTPLYFLSDEIQPPAGGKPLDSSELMPIYEAMAEYDLPIWIHPNPLHNMNVADYTSETVGKYFAWRIFGWPYQDTLAQVRLVFSGILERFPNLKFINHHAGAMVPYFESRVASMYNDAEMYAGLLSQQGLNKSPIEYFRKFHNDTALNGSTAGLMCAYAFYGAERLLFGSDMPFDREGGNIIVGETIRSIEQMDISHQDKIAIFEGNARRILLLE